MKRMIGLGVLCAAMAAGVQIVVASDRVAVYALIDRVVLEPGPDNPERIQIWGVFSVAKPEDRDLYQPAERGYLYFTASSRDRELIRHEWADLKASAGTGRVVSFGTRFAETFRATPARVRPSSEKPASPDVYESGLGVGRMRSDTDYAPVRSLLDLARR
jgi:hypothetical protein